MYGKEDCLTLENETGCTETSVQTYPFCPVEILRRTQISFALRHKLEIMQVVHFLSAEISGHIVDFLSQTVNV